jgi:tetratricopeptide (TPR) repeat protein
VPVTVGSAEPLKLMAPSPDERVVPPIARDVCQREGAKVMVTGSILRLGEKYVLDMDAANCLTGAVLAHQQIEAASQNQVLSRLGQIIPPLRRTLGESVRSIQKFDTPIEQATTKSLTALKAYTTGDMYRSQGKDEESIPYYKTAVDTDPEFAIAYARLSAIHHNIQLPELAKLNIQKAYERREHVTQREQFYIAAHYYETEPEEAIKN